MSHRGHGRRQRVLLKPPPPPSPQTYPSQHSERIPIPTCKMSALKRNPLSLEAAVDILAATFNDPLKSHACASRLRVATDRVDEEINRRKSASDRVKFAKSQSRLLRRGIKFFTLKQCPAEYMVMVNVLLRCTCNFKDQKIRELHIPGQHIPDGIIYPADMDCLRLAVRSVVRCISLALSAITKSKFRALEESSAEPGHVKPWPLDADDLLPSGIQSSIDTLTLWASEAGGWATYKLMAALGGFYQPFLDALIQPPEYELALRLPTREISLALDWFEKDPALYKASPSLITDPLDAVFDYLLMLVPDAKFNDMVRALVSTVVPVFERLKKLLPSIPGGDAWRSNIAVGSEMILSIAKDDLKALQSRTSALGTSDPIYDSLTDMIVARKGACAYVFCPRSQDTTYSRLCTTCDVLRFCGPECQKSAWKAQIYPHKALCQRIHELREQLGPEIWERLWKAEMTTDQFLELETSQPLVLGNIRAIGRELHALKTLRILSRQLGVS